MAGSFESSLAREKWNSYKMKRSINFPYSILIEISQGEKYYFLISYDGYVTYSDGNLPHFFPPPCLPVGRGEGTGGSTSILSHRGERRCFVGVIF
jgi:hypothetical protein